MIDGRSSRGLGEWKGDSGRRLMWLCMGGSSTEECMRGLLASFSETLSYVRAVSCVVELGKIFVFSLQLRNPSPSPVYGCGAVLGQQQPWLQLDKHPPKSFEVQVSRGLGGSRFYHVRRLLVSALLYASMSGSCVPELPNGLLGGGG